MTACGCGEPVLRVQDASGRGPFRPGFTHEWADTVFIPGQDPLPPWFAEFGFDLLDSTEHGEHVGCAVRTHAQICRWFSAPERARLSALGFSVVETRAGRVLAESENQLVFANRMPLRYGVVTKPWP